MPCTWNPPTARSRTRPGSREGQFDGFVSVGGGSTIDTCKAANLYATYPADFLDYVNKGVGAGKEVPGPLKPHIACPTTCGTGSECTGITVCDMLSLKVKTGIASRRLRPSIALVDPACTDTLPGPVVAASGFDQLSHALEAYTARPFTERPRPEHPLLRPISQGANPWSDIGSLEALRLAGRFLVRAVCDASDREARERILFASTLAGIAFGNAGVHLPHAMAYGVAGQVRDFRMPEYPAEEPLVPHGVSVIVNAPAVFRATVQANPQRHLAAAAALGADTSRARAEEAGELLAQTIIGMMQQTGIPNGISGVGYTLDDVAALAAGTMVQKRLLAQAPIPVDHDVVAGLFRGGMSYWAPALPRCEALMSVQA